MIGKVNAVISGQSGVALLMYDGKLASLHAGRGVEVVRRHPSEARLLLGDATDLQVLENADIGEVSRRLEIATTQRDALHIALILLDGSLTGDTRREAAGELQELLEEEALTVFVESVLFSSPLPADADLAGARELATNAPRAIELLERLVSLQKSIREVREAWKRIPARIFGSDEKRAQAQAVAVREGVFRTLVLEHSSSRGLHKALRLPVAFTSLSDSRAISREWWRNLDVRPGDEKREESGFLHRLLHFSEALSGGFRLAAAGSGALVLLIFLRVGWIGWTARAQAKEKETRASAAALTSYGQESLRVGDPSLAIESFDKSLALYRKLDNSQGERAFVLASQAKAYQELKRSDLALGSFRKAANLSKVSGDRQIEAQSLAGIGSILCRQESYEEAVSKLREAQEIARSLDSDSEVAAHLGLCIGRQGRDRLPLEPELESPVAHVAALLGSSVAIWKEGKVEEALGRAREAALAEEALTAQERREVGRSAAEWSQGTSSDLLIQLLMEKHRQAPAAGHDSEAFEVYEKAIARTATDSVVAASSRLKADPSVPEELRVRVSVSLPPSTVSLRDVQEKILDDKTVLLEYYLGEPRSFLWVVTRESIESFELADRLYLEDAIRSAYSAVVDLTPGSPIPAWRRMLAASLALLGPAAGRLLSSDLSLSDLLIVAPGPLAYFPFAALPLPGVLAELSPSRRWGACLLERYKIFMAPSASMLLAVRKNAAQKEPARRELVVLADPVVSRDDPRLEQTAPKADAPPESKRFHRLPYSRQEAETILALLSPSESLLAAGFEADRRAVFSGLLKGVRIVHFATHSSPDPEEPLLASLVLSLFDRQGRPVPGELRAAEVAGLDLSATELVVLSTRAFYRDRGELPRWEEATLPASFLEAGASRVLFNTWCVSDRAAADLMADFYRGLLVERLSVSDALRQTQRRLLRDRRYGDPYYWAGFTLQGDWS